MKNFNNKIYVQETLEYLDNLIKKNIYIILNFIYYFI